MSWLNDSLSAYSVTNILPYLTAAFPNITGDRAVFIQVGNIGIINFQLKASASFEDGVATLPSTIPGTKTVVNGALSGLHGQCGFAEYNGHYLRVRITRNADAFINGQLVFPIA